MRVLQLCKKFPYPVKDGESLAITYLSKALHQLGCEVSLLAMNTTKHHSNDCGNKEQLDFYQTIDVVQIDNRVKVKDAIANLFSKDSFHISRFVSEAFEEKLKKLLKSQHFDIIQLETLYLAPYIPTIRQYSKAKIVMRSHNVEHEIWERVTHNTQMGPKKWYLNHLTQKLRNYEIQRLNDYDLFAAITQRDLERYRQLGFNGKGVNIPIGIDMNDYEWNAQAFQKPLSVSFIGSLDWMPNIEGVKWFLDKVWPEMKQQFPQLTFHIAGRNTPDWLLKSNLRDVIVHGEVEDAHEFINQHPIMVVPLQAGSGMRVKILEAMALGRIVLTTSIGVEGIHAEHQEEVFVADTPKEFLSAMRICHRKNGSLRSIGEKAKDFIGKEFDNTQIAQKLLDRYHQIIHKKTQSIV